MTARWCRWFFVPANKIGSNEAVQADCQQRKTFKNRGQNGPHKRERHPLAPLIQETEYFVSVWYEGRADVSSRPVLSSFSALTGAQERIYSVGQGKTLIQNESGNFILIVITYLKNKK
jgi:hypothetical protein